MGNTGISRGKRSKGKSLSHLDISFPTKKPPSTPPPHQGQTTLDSYVSPRGLPTTEKLGKEKLDKTD